MPLDRVPTFAHVSGLCDIKYIQRGEQEHLLTCGVDSLLKVHDVNDRESDKEIDDHKDAITVVAVSPKGDRLATASEDRSVKVYNYLDGFPKFESNITRFQLPIRALAFNPSGTNIAAAGDDAGVKLVNVADGAVFRVINGASSSVTDLAYDPKGDYIAGVTSEGTVHIWDISTGESVCDMIKAAPAVDTQEPIRNRIAWHPDGSLLAVPDPDRGVVFYARDNDFSESFRLNEGHSNTVSLFSWCPNGLYAISAATDSKLMLWDMSKKQDIDKQSLESPACAVCWHPSDNRAALINEDGYYITWGEVVPKHLPPPGKPIQEIDQSLYDFGDDEPAADKADDDDALSGEEDLDQYEEDADPPDDGQAAPKPSRRRGGSRAVAAPPPMIMQAAIQSGTTSATDDDPRRFLAYNMLGCIISRQEDAVASVEVALHDAGAHGGRYATMTDYFGYTLGALSEHGCVLAGPSQAGGHPSTVMFRPAASWASDSEWTVHFPAGEDARCVAVGSSWVAAATSANLLRLYTHSGLQTFVSTLEGAPVAVAGHGSVLAVVWHSGAPSGPPPGAQQLAYVLYDVPTGRQLARGALPLGGGSATLTWLDFTEQGLLAAADSEGVVRVRVEAFGGSWVPVFHSAHARKAASETHFVVGLTSEELYCIVCSAPYTEPRTHPRPVLTALPLAVPVAGGQEAPAGGAGDLEELYVRKSVLRTQAAASGASVEELRRQGVELDKNLLKMFSAACNNHRLARALDLASMLTLTRSLEGAHKLANGKRLPVLADRVGALLQSRLHEAPSPTPTQLTTPVMSTRPAADYTSHTPPTPVMGGLESQSQSTAQSQGISRNEAAARRAALQQSNRATEPPPRPEGAARKADAGGDAISALKRKLAAGAGTGGGLKAAKTDGAPPPTAKATSNPFARAK